MRLAYRKAGHDSRGDREVEPCERRVAQDVRRRLHRLEEISYQAYINNFTSNVGYSGGSYVQALPNYARFRNVARPRTYGLQLRYRF